MSYRFGMGAAAPTMPPVVRRHGLTVIPGGRRVGRNLVPGSPRRIGRRFVRGMGVLNYYDLLAQANLQNCDPRDSACVADNVAKQAAVEDYWAAHQATGVPSGTQLSFAPLTQAQVTGFYNPTPTAVSNIVPTGIMSVFTSSPTEGVAPAPTYNTVTPAAPAPKATAPVGSAAPAPGTPGGPAVISSSGTNQPASSSVPSGFSLSSIPWWGWAAAGAGVLFFIRGR